MGLPRVAGPRLRECPSARSRAISWSRLEGLLIGAGESAPVRLGGGGFGRESAPRSGPPSRGALVEVGGTSDPRAQGGVEIGSGLPVAGPPRRPGGESCRQLPCRLALIAGATTTPGRPPTGQFSSLRRRNPPIPHTYEFPEGDSTRVLRTGEYAGVLQAQAGCPAPRWRFDLFPCLSAIATAWARVWAPSFVIAFWTCGLDRLGRHAAGARAINAAPGGPAATRGANHLVLAGR